MREHEFKQQLASSGLSAIEASKKARSFGEAANSLRAMGTHGEDLLYYFVPGRIEFLGKHTDYAGGRSLICALERGFCVSAIRRNDLCVRIIDAQRPDQIEFGLTADLVPFAGHWSNYPMTVASRIAQNFPGNLRGADIAFISDLPPTAGLSSSSALVVAIFCVLARINALDQRLEYKKNIGKIEDLAGYLGAIENGSNFGSLAGSKGVGTFGGSQDHCAILCCRRGQLSQYSFCPVRHERSIRLPGDYTFVIGVSGVSADKSGDALEKYNRISLLASEVLAIWRSVTGRTDLTLMEAAASSEDAPAQIREALRTSRSTLFSPQELINRFDQFFIESTEIIPAVADALAAGETDKIGLLIDRSQEGAENLLGNQAPETIALPRLARELGAVAASAFGAGFGGSVWALVETEHAESFKSQWSQRYRSQFQISPARSPFFSTCAGPAMIDFSAF